MANLNSMLPWVPSQYFDTAGRPLSGGRIYTYQSGTNTPKATFATADGSVVNTNPVILDASGRGLIFPGVGAYRIAIHDRHDILVEPPVDGVVAPPLNAAAGENVETSDVVVVKTYADLRALQGAYHAVYVAGRTTPGDGGQGLFYLDHAETHGDDDGISLVTGAGLYYLRSLDGYVDPQWYGVVYGSVSGQDVAFDNARAASATYRLPVFVDGIVYLASGITFGVGQSIECSPYGRFASGFSIQLLFPSGSYFRGTGVCFSAYVIPVFSRLAVDHSEIKLSWFSDPDPVAKWAKFVDSAPVGTRLVVDIDISVNGDIVIPADRVFTPAGGIVYVTGSNRAISIPSFDIPGYTQAIDISGATVASVDMPGMIRPEWLGAVGDGIVDDSKALAACFLAGQVELDSKTYLQDTTYGGVNEVSIYGLDNAIWKLGANVTFPSLNLTDIQVSAAQARSINTTDIVLRDTVVDISVSLNTTNIYAADSSFAFGAATINGSKTYSNVANTSLAQPYHEYVNKPKINDTLLAGVTKIENQVSGYAMTVDGSQTIISTDRPLIRTAIESFPRILANSYEQYDTPAGGGRMLVMAPVHIMLRTYFKSADLLRAFASSVSGAAMTVSVGIGRVVAGSMEVLATGVASSLQANPTIQQVIDAGVLLTTLESYDNIFFYLSVVSSGATGRFQAIGAPLITIGSNHYVAAKMTTNGATHPARGEVLDLSAQTGIPAAPWILVAPGA